MPQPACLALDATTNLRTLGEHIWERFTYRGFAFYLIVPPDVDVAKQLPISSAVEVGRWQSPDMAEDFQTKYADFEKLRMPKRFVRANACGALLLAGLLPTNDNSVVVCPDAELEASRSGELLRWYHEQYGDEEHTRQRFRDEEQEGSAEVTICWDPKAKPEELWTNRSVRLVPQFLWTWALDGTPLTVAFLGSFPRLMIHTRNFSKHSAGQLRVSEFVATLLKVVEGEAPRSENDVFGERDDLMLTYDWHVQERDREEIPLDQLVGYERFPLHRMDEICEIEELEDWTPESSETKTCWIPSTGDAAGGFCLRHPLRKLRSVCCASGAKIRHSCCHSLRTSTSTLVSSLRPLAADESQDSARGRSANWRCHGQMRTSGTACCNR